MTRENAPLAQQVGFAKASLSFRPDLLADLLEAFFQPRAVHVVRFMNEDGLRSIIEALWYDPINKDSTCIPKLCLVANPKVASGQGRYRFADIYFPSSSFPTVLKLKNASLEGLWRSQGDSDTSPDASLVLLRERLKTEAPEQLLHWRVKYWKDGKWTETTIDTLKKEAFEQVEEYMDIMKHGGASANRSGVQDSRVTSILDQCLLTGYAAICIGGTRVLAWLVRKETIAHCYLAKGFVGI
jgi:hypothetical protein